MGYQLSESASSAGGAELTLNACWSQLRGAQVGRLAVWAAGQVDIFPVNFAVDSGTIVIRTAEGTKFAAALLGPSVAFEVDGYDPVAGEAWSVVVKGFGEEIDRLDDVLAAMRLPLFPWHAAPKHRYLRIVPNEVTGRVFRVVQPDP